MTQKECLTNIINKFRILLKASEEKMPEDCLKETEIVDAEYDIYHKTEN